MIKYLKIENVIEQTVADNARYIYVVMCVHARNAYEKQNNITANKGHVHSVAVKNVPGTKG